MDREKFRLRRLASVLAIGACFSASAVADALTDEALSLLDSGRGNAAYALLEPQESARAGEVDYDFLLGLAALDAGQNTRAVFALERVLAVDPNHVRARAEIARAYLALGEVETARQEFETVQRQGVPADVSQTLDRYIAAARRQENLDRPTLNAYVEAVIGYDTNVNVGPNKTSVVIPGISSAPALLSPDSKANKDAFGQVGAGFSGRLPLTGELALLAGLSWSQRMNQDKDQFDLGSADGNLGAVYSSGRNVFTLMGQFGTVRVDNVRYRRAGGMTGQWQYNIDARNQFSAYVQRSSLNYDKQSVRDADRTLGGIAYAHMWRDGLVAFGSLYLVDEKAEQGRFDFLGFDGFGVRLGARANIGARLTIFGGLSYERRHHDAVDPSFLVTRRDHQRSLLLGATYGFAKDWTITPQVSLMRNGSNTELNEYHREMVSLTIRREF